MSVRSMTGYARVRRQIPAGEILLSVKSINHRGLDVHFHASSELEPFEIILRAVLRRHVLRGHVQIQIRLASAGAAGVRVLNRALLEEYLRTFRQVASEHALGHEPDLNAALSAPGMFVDAPEADPDPEIGQALAEALEEALGLLNQFREREGEEIAADMRARNETVRERVAWMESVRGQAAMALQERMKVRLAELPASIALDPQRLAQEVALLLDRSDISEELTRLKIHAAQLDELLRAGGEIGKKLDFLLQEMHRETNTILSKASGIGEVGLVITGPALEIRAEIEKMREQSLNLE